MEPAKPTVVDPTPRIDPSHETANAEKVYNAIKGKGARLDRYFDYYNGTADIPIISDRLRDVYQSLNLRVGENWAAVVVDSTADRITLTDLQGSDTNTTELLKDAMDQTELLLEADDAHQAAVIAGESFIIAGKDDDDQLECFYNDPRMCHMEYDAARPNVPKMAGKIWDDDSDGQRHIKIYTATHIEEWSAPKQIEKVLEVDALELIDRIDNPFKMIPVFHLRPHRRNAYSDLQNVIPIMDAITILVINMLITAEYSAAPMKYIIGNMEGVDDLVVAPNRIWHIPGSDGLTGGSPQVGQFAASELTNYLAAIDHLISSLASISRTPRHYFEKGVNAPSGQALKSLEGPVVRKCRDRIARFEPTWRRLGSFLCMLQGTEVKPQDIKAIFDKPETSQPLEDASVVKALADAQVSRIEAGISLEQSLREMGFTEELTAKIIKEKEAEAQALAAKQGASFAQGFAP